MNKRETSMFGSKFVSMVDSKITSMAKSSFIWRTKHGSLSFLTNITLNLHLLVAARQQLDSLFVLWLLMLFCVCVLSSQQHSFIYFNFKEEKLCWNGVRESKRKETKELWAYLALRSRNIGSHLAQPQWLYCIKWFLTLRETVNNLYEWMNQSLFHRYTISISIHFSLS